MIKNKVVDLGQYKSQKILEKQLEELDRIADEQYQHMSPIEQKGYRNFMRLLKAIDEHQRQQENDEG